MAFNAERELCVGSTYFEQKNLYKYTRVARGQDGLEAKSMIDLALVKGEMLRYVQDVRAVREVVDRAWKVRSEKQREHQYREGYARFLEGKRVEEDGENNVKHIWEQVKLVMVESTRKVCGSVRVGGGDLKSVWWNYQVKAQVKRC